MAIFKHKYSGVDTLDETLTMTVSSRTVRMGWCIVGDRF